MHCMNNIKRVFKTGGVLFAINKLVLFENSDEKIIF